MVLPNFKSLYAKAFQNWTKDNAPRLAAAFSFYAMLALAPMLLLFVAVGSRLLGDSQSGLHIVHVAEGYLGHDGAKFLEDLIATTSKPAASAIAGIVSVLLAIYGAANLFEQLSESIDAIWNAPHGRTGIKGFIVGKLLSVLMFIAFAIIFLSWLAIDSWIGWIEAHTPGFQGWAIVSFLISTVFLTFVFAISFRAMPKRMVSWSDVWFGAITSAAGLAVSKFLLSLYFSYSTVFTAYGSAGALVIILLWVYYSAQIYFFGIEVTCTYAHMHGSQMHRHKGEPPIPQHN